VEVGGWRIVGENLVGEFVGEFVRESVGELEIVFCCSLLEVGGCRERRKDVPWAALDMANEQK